jgi:hypothetical protein
MKSPDDPGLVLAEVALVAVYTLHAAYHGVWIWGIPLVHTAILLLRLTR